MNKCVRAVTYANQTNRFCICKTGIMFQHTCTTHYSLCLRQAFPSNQGLRTCLKNTTIHRLHFSLGSSRLLKNTAVNCAVPDFEGEQYERDNDILYQDVRYQYATSSHEDHTDPQLILYPKNINDIKSAIKYARSKKVAIATRTGGHQYSGASSTSGPNIQLDVSQTFANDISYREENGKHLVRASVSWELKFFNKFLGDHGLFIPHGQCSHVHVGGHVQTGGYGQLGRSFGLFSDHVVSLEMVNCDGEHVKITKDDEDLFYAILGGSPGNFGVLTHFTVSAYSNKNYEGSCGLKGVYKYDTGTLKKLLDILVDMANDENFPRNYDYCVNVASSSCRLTDFFSELNKDKIMLLSELYGEDPKRHPRMIVVYAQYVPFAKTDKCDLGWFYKINKCGEALFPIISPNEVEHNSMSELTKKWMFTSAREYDYPYEKETHLTSSKTLVADGWADWVVGRIDEIVAPEDNHCYLSIQIQNFGGNNSRFYCNRNNGTSYSWRDSTLVATLDCFYDFKSFPYTKETAEEWQSKNDSEGIGPNGKFSKEDRRVLWGSYGEYNMGRAWPYYHEDQDKYDRLCKIKRDIDPDGVFTPNTFCVGVDPNV